MLVDARTHHRFFNPTPEPVRFHLELRPGTPRAEQGFRILYGLARDGKTNAASVPKSLSHLAVVLPMTDMYASGLLRLLQPVLGFLARRASANGTEQALIATFCTPDPSVHPSDPVPSPS